MNRFAIATFLCAATIGAQTPPPPPVQTAPGPIIPQQLQQQRLMADPRFADQLIPDMNVEQRSKLEIANAAFRKAVDPLEARLRTSRKELDDAANSEKLDETAIRAKAQEIGAVEGDIAVARANRLVKVREFLTPEQVKRFTAISPMFDRRMMTPPGQFQGSRPAEFPQPGPRTIPARPQPPQSQPQSQPQEAPK